MATEVTRIVDPGEGGGYHYSTLDAWEDALGGTTTGHLVNDDMIAIAQCRDSSGVTPDVTAVDILGWTTDATRYIAVIGIDFPSDGIFDATKYHLAVTDATALGVTEEYVRIRNIQVSVTSASGTAIGLRVNAGVATTDILFDSCIIKGTCSGSGSGYGILVGDADAIVTVTNCVAYGFISGSDTGFYGILSSASTAMNVYNCTVYNCYRGIGRSAGTVTATNCAVFNCTDDFYGTITMTYCASDDDHTGDSATNVTITQQGDPVDYAALVTNAAGGDFSVTDVNSELYDAGTPDLFTEDDDIIGTARPQGDHWDIGAFELVAAGSSSSSHSSSSSSVSSSHSSSSHSSSSHSSSSHSSSSSSVSSSSSSVSSSHSSSSHSSSSSSNT